MAQVLLNSLASAGSFLLVGVGFSLIYSTARFFHLAHGAVITAGAYAAFALRVRCDLPMWLAVVGGVAASALLGAGMESGVYRGLRKRGASSGVLLLASLGIYVALQAVITLVFGSGTVTFREGIIPETRNVLGGSLTLPQTWILAAATMCSLLMWLLLRLTRTGKTIRAVSTNPELAEACGIDRDRVILLVFIWGSALAGLAAVLLAYDADIRPTMGFSILLIGMVAVIIGGIGSLPGAVLGSLLIGLLMHLSSWWISSKWQGALLFALLIVFMVLRPQGCLGRPVRKASV